MTPALRILRDSGAIALSGALLALLANAVPPHGLSLTKDYFETNRPPTASLGYTTEAITAVRPATGEHAAARRGVPIASHERVLAWFHDPRYLTGQILFVDARARDRFVRGHIPGAHLFDHYHPERDLSSVVAAAQVAERVVVYCSGGDCEDSGLAANDLIDAGVPSTKLVIYGGGITEWTTWPARGGAIGVRPMTAPRQVSPPATIAARWVVGGIFVHLGWLKAADPVGFLKLVHQFGVVASSPHLNIVAAVLPWFEVFCGALLLLGIKPRAAALVQFALLLGFTGVVLWRALAIYHAGGTAFCAIHFDCGCGTGDILICTKLIENVSLLILTAMVVTRPNRSLCLWAD